MKIILKDGGCLEINQYREFYALEQVQEGQTKTLYRRRSLSEIEALADYVQEKMITNGWEVTVTRYTDINQFTNF